MNLQVGNDWPGEAGGEYVDLKTEIQVLEKLLKEKREELKVAEAIEKQKDELWKRHVAALPTNSSKDERS